VDESQAEIRQKVTKGAQRENYKESDDALDVTFSRFHEFLAIVNSELREKGADLIVDEISFLSTWRRFGLIGRGCTDIHDV
jgi:ATP-dependent exoDNAse (exonuclease V) alpha subunit